MKMGTMEFFWRFLALTAWLFSAQVQAVSIRYQASDLRVTVSGQDLWRYVYQVSGNLTAFSGFNVLFDSTLYGSLEDFPVAPNADWISSTSQPVSSLPADGLYTAIAAQDNASLADPFTVSFVWLGTGTPGAQTFEVFGADFLVIETGSTSPFGAPAIPEPGSLLLVAGALGLLGWRNRRC